MFIYSILGIIACMIICIKAKKYIWEHDKMLYLCICALCINYSIYNLISAEVIKCLNLGALAINY